MLALNMAVPVDPSTGGASTSRPSTCTHQRPPHTPPPLSEQVVNYAYLASPSTAFPWATLQLGRIHHTLELWQVGGRVLG